MCCHCHLVQDLDKAIAAGHENWFGKLKKWKQLVWAVLSKRLVDNTLTVEKCQIPALPEPSVQPMETPAASSSSSAAAWLGFQTTVNEAAPPVAEQQRCFPKAAVVETTEIVDPEVDEAPVLESSEECLQERMARWWEMVESVEMLEQMIGWINCPKAVA